MPNFRAKSIPVYLHTISSLLKIRLAFLVTFCASISFVIAGGSFYTLKFLFLTFSTFLTASGSCALNNYLDQDIDLVMNRTKGRPLPSNKIEPKKVLIIGFLLIFFGLSVAYSLGFKVFFVGLAACINYLLVYTKFLKRLSPVNIIVGSPAGGLPVLGGWIAASGSLSTLPFLLACLVILWIPNHIWSLAALHRDDYKKAKVPMLPATVDLKKALRCNNSTIILLFFLTIYLYLADFFGEIYLVLVLPLGIFILIGNIFVSIKPTERGFYRMFKLSSPYLAFLFLSMFIDVSI